MNPESPLSLAARADELANAATKGPWFRCDPPWGDGTSVHNVSHDPHASTMTICEWDLMSEQFRAEADDIDCDNIAEAWKVHDNMAFISASRTLVPALAAAVRELVDENDRLRNQKCVHELAKEYAESTSPEWTRIRTDLPDRVSEAMERPATDDGKERE